LETDSFQQLPLFLDSWPLPIYKAGYRQLCLSHFILFWPWSCVFFLIYGMFNYTEFI
jgi:hypothetical protein